MDLQRLNQDYGIAGSLKFVERESGFPLIEITNSQGSGLISIYAGHVLSYRPAGATEDVIFLSSDVVFKEGKAIRGGVPICWPWFGPDPEGLGRTNHGFVRDRLWSVISTETTTSGATRVILGLKDTAETRQIWDYSFELAIAITVGSSLTLELITRNTGDKTFTITQALHTYFQIGDISQTKVLGLDNCDYIDKVDGGKQKNQLGEVAIASEVDRVYLAVPNTLTIEDPALSRRINIHSKNSKTAIIWNPWIEKAANMGDLGDTDYKTMICVETANAADDAVKISPQSEYNLTAIYTLENL
ncbi:MAG: D-hexose-6-phosphate mutarotase [Limnothrix sp. RL_2_0]|nr:D-hexose-6-phosphate mutarotase [Limnothrix sp. RL_2_0]